MGNFLSIPILMIAAALQATFLPEIRLLGGAPDLVFLIVISWSLNARLEDGIVWSFVGGIWQDLLSAAPTGASVVGMLMIIFAISGIGQQVYRIGLILLIISVIVGTILKQLMFYFVLTLNGFTIDWITTIAYMLLPTLFYNMVLIWPVYWIVRRIQRRVTTRRSGVSS